MTNPDMTTNLERIQQIVARKQHSRLKFPGIVREPIKMDLYTASALMAVYNALNDTNKAKFARMLETPSGLAKMIDFSWKNVMNPIRPRLHPYKGRRLAKRNPEYAYGPTGYRPPKKWFDHMLAKMKKSYKGTKGELSRLVGGIWAKQTDKVRAEIVKKYEPSAANPLTGVCPLHGNPISVNPKAKRVRCPHGHTLRVPRR